MGDTEMVLAIAALATCLIATVVLMQRPKERPIRIRVRKDERPRR